MTFSSCKLHTDSMEKAEILSNQFKSVFTQEDTTVIPHLHGPDYPTISILDVTSIGVTKLLNGINPKKAHGPDEIPCRILRELDNELTPALTAIFNQSLKTGELPLVWNEAIVTPIYKKGDRIICLQIIGQSPWHVCVVKFLNISSALT